ncbi:hypothetical protein VTL71DRAFT_4593 [Oculimacula yallundae]
MYRCGL